MPKCPNCQKEVYFGEMSAFFTSLLSFNAHFLVSCLEKETRTAEPRGFHADICEVFRGEKVPAWMRPKPVAARLANLKVPRNTNVHERDTSGRVLS